MKGAGTAAAWAPSAVSLLTVPVTNVCPGRGATPASRVVAVAAPAPDPPLNWSKAVVRWAATLIPKAMAATETTRATK